MTGASDPPPAKRRDYVVPLPRATDALGRSLRHVFAVHPEAGAFVDLMRRLDAIH